MINGRMAIDIFCFLGVFLGQRERQRVGEDGGCGGGGDVQQRCNSKIQIWKVVLYLESSCYS